MASFPRFNMTLAELLSQSPPLPWEQAVDLLQRIAAALYSAHRQGRVAGDLRPEMIRISEEGDIFISALEDATPSNLKEDALPYLAPEQIQGAPSTPQSDQFSLAVLFYEIITGQKPFESEDPALLRHLILAEPPALLPSDISVPMGAYSTLSRALAKAPEKRHDDVMSFVDAVNALSLEEQVSEAIASGRGRRFVLAGIALLVIAALAFLLAPGSHLVTAMLFSTPTPTATETPRAAIIIPTATPTDTPTPTPNVTPTLIVASTAEGGGVEAISQSPPTPTATFTPLPTPTPIPTPTFTPTRPPTPTPKPRPPTPTISKKSKPKFTSNVTYHVSLLEPAPGAEGSKLHLRWDADPLAPGLAFEPVIWSSPDPQAILRSGMSPTGMVENSEVLANVQALEGIALLQLTPGHDYFWAICIVQKDPYQRLWCSEGRAFRYAGGGGGGDSGGGGGGGGSCPPDC